ncbi:hypothetical protein [Streptomyces olindensis]|uniref:hypothetical protein n=1 Tax=Streptomyces olindensis TaxID=358823 RepID=UPI0033D57C85
MISEADARRLLQRFDELEIRYTERYGPLSQARTFLLVEELVTIRHGILESAAEATGILTGRRDELVLRIQELYDASPFPAGPPPPVRRLPGSSALIEFDRAYFAERYAAASRSVRQETVRLQDWRPSPQTRPSAYMYVVDDRGDFLVWTRPFRMSDLVLGRNRATVDGVPVAHPMLVPERLRVQAAGEVTPVLSDKLQGLVTNLKSGHFRPPPATAAAVRRAFSRSLGLDEHECDVLTVPEAPSGTVPEVTGQRNNR